MTVKTPIYLDYAATCPVDPRVVDAMIPCFTQTYGNAASRTHAFGWAAEEAVEQAREQIAQTVGAEAKEIAFTSGATESDNLAIKGVAEYLHKSGDHIVTVVTEHKAVLDSCKYLERRGHSVTYLPVDAQGLVTAQQVADAITDRTVLVSVMFANNETGVIQPIADIGRVCHERKVLFHTDAVQAFGKVPIDVERMHIDLMSLSAHKIYGPKGIGALYVRRKKPRVRIAPLMHGGSQERGLRAGTLPVHQIVGFGEAMRLAGDLLADEGPRLAHLRERLRAKIEEGVPETVLNGSLEHRLPGNLNISFTFVEGESLLMALRDVAVSSGSACTSASLEPSYVLRAIGLDDENAHSSIRFGIGRFNTEEEVDYVADLVVKAVAKLRALSPLWEMHQEGIDLKSIEWAAH
ncbi:MAG: IscS subfamily cysteine desulfurase [Myxococcales bacterium]|nr:IscS subfamily cysteine desulfurase [Myxococcales bacterium]